MKILIVEDEALIALTLQHSLAEMGFEVCTTVASGEQAVQAARREMPDVILMDIRLKGGIDGLETARRIRTFLDAELLFLTGYSDPEMRKHIAELAPLAYLIKPVEPGQIAGILNAGRARIDGLQRS